MLLTDTWLFGKLKGKTLEQTLKCEADREWIYWYVDQQSNKPEFAERDASQKKSLKRHLERTESGSPGNPEDVNSMMFIAGELKPMKERIARLEEQVKSLLIVYKKVAPKEEPAEEKVANTKNQADVAWDE